MKTLNVTERCKGFPKTAQVWLNGDHIVEQFEKTPDVVMKAVMKGMTKNIPELKASLKNNTSETEVVYFDYKGFVYECQFLFIGSIMNGTAFDLFTIASVLDH